MAVLTLANQLTILRILLIPAFVLLVVYGYLGGALLVFLIAGVTDMLDGIIARWAHQRTNLGAWLDPMADKLLLVTTYIVLTIPSIPLTNYMPFWLTVLTRNNTKKLHFPNVRTLSSYAPCQCLLKVRPLAHRPTFNQKSFLFSPGKTSNFPHFSSPVALQTAIHKNTHFFIDFWTTFGSHFGHFCLLNAYPKTCLLYTSPSPRDRG